MKSLNATRAECDAALPHILQAPQDSAAIECLCFRPGFEQREFPQAITVTQSGGIRGERWSKAPWLRLPDGSGHPGIQISILPKRVADLCWRNRTHVIHPGDTMIADLNVTEQNMPAGTRLRIGTSTVEVSEVFNTGCAKWYARYGAPSLAWINHRPNRMLRLRGILCRIVEDGEIRRSDIIMKV